MKGHVISGKKIVLLALPQNCVSSESLHLWKSSEGIVGDALPPNVTIQLEPKTFCMKIMEI